MKRKRFSVEQIVAVLKQAEMGAPVADLIRHLGNSGTQDSNPSRSGSANSCKKRTRS